MSSRRASWISLSLLTLLGLAPIARAGSRATLPPRFHRLTPRLVGRLAPGAQKLLRSVVTFHSASGVVLHDDGHGKGLLLTNEHVMRTGPTGGETITFFDGTQAKTARLLAIEPTFDYALLEIDLPAGGMNRAAAAAPFGMVGGRKLYTIASHPNLAFPTTDPDAHGFTSADAAVGGGRRTHAAIAAGPANQFAIALGRADRGGDISLSVPGAVLHGVASDLPNSAGMSGSPLADAQTHAVIALHSSGADGPPPRPDWKQGYVSGRWRESSIPLRLIFDDLRLRLDAGRFDGPAGQLVDGLLRGADPAR